MASPQVSVTAKGVPGFAFRVIFWPFWALLLGTFWEICFIFSRVLKQIQGYALAIRVQHSALATWVLLADLTSLKSLSLSFTLRLW